MSGHEDPGLLLDTLAIAVPAEIGKLREAEEGRGAVVASRLRDPDGPLMTGDAVLYGGQGCATGFAAFARALAVLAFQPGGVRFGPLHWCAAHPRERRADGDVICPACLREEIAAGAG